MLKIRDRQLARHRSEKSMSDTRYRGDLKGTYNRALRRHSKLEAARALDRYLHPTDLPTDPLEEIAVERRWDDACREYDAELKASGHNPWPGPGTEECWCSDWCTRVAA